MKWRTGYGTEYRAAAPLRPAPGDDGEQPRRCQDAESRDLPESAEFWV